ncbi:MAG TPA: hypothetical protein VF985_07875, partial [Mariniflexile sp.]
MPAIAIHTPSTPKPSTKKSNGYANGQANGHTNGHKLTPTTLPGWDVKKMKKRVRIQERGLNTGLGKAVAKRTILRGKEKWVDVAKRVAKGNSLLIPGTKRKHRQAEYEVLKKHIANASLLMSGRHLQHGDESQPNRNMEVFTNCATSS